MKRIALLSLTAFLISCAWGAVAMAGPIMPPEIPPIIIPPVLTSIPCDSTDTTYHTDSFSADAENYGMTLHINNNDKYDVEFFGRLKVGTNFGDLFELQDEFSVAPLEYRHQRVMVLYENPSAPSGIAAYPVYCFPVTDDPDNSTKGVLIKCFSIAQSSADGKGCAELVDAYKEDERLVIFTAVRVYGSSDGFCNEGPRMKMKDLIAKGDAFGGICTEPPAPPEEAEAEEEGEEVAVGPTLDPGLGTYTPSDEEAVDETGMVAAEGKHCSLAVNASAGFVQIIVLMTSLLLLGARRRH